MQLGTRYYLITLNYIDSCIDIRIAWTVIEGLSAARAYVHFWAKLLILTQFERKWKKSFIFYAVNKNWNRFFVGWFHHWNAWISITVNLTEKNVYRPFHPAALQLHSLQPTEAMLVTYIRKFAPHYLSAQSLVVVKLVNMSLEWKVTISLLLLLKSASIAEIIWHFSTKEARKDSQEPTSLGYK